MRRLRQDDPLAAVVVPTPGIVVDGASLVVDVHSPEAIRLAEVSSPVVKDVMVELGKLAFSRASTFFRLQPGRLIASEYRLAPVSRLPTTTVPGVKRPGSPLCWGTFVSSIEPNSA